MILQIKIADFNNEYGETTSELFKTSKSPKTIENDNSLYAGICDPPRRLLNRKLKLVIIKNYALLSGASRIKGIFSETWENKDGKVKVRKAITISNAEEPHTDL